MIKSKYRGGDIMSLFKKKKPEDKLSFKIKMAERMTHNRLRYATEREDGVETVIGKGGGFNVRDGELIVTTEEGVILRCNIADMSVSELLSMEGVIITAPDLEHGGKTRTIIAYYVYYR